MTRLRSLRKDRKLKLREIALLIGVTPSTVHDAEMRGLRTPRAAKKYELAFPGLTWKDLLEDPTSPTRPTSPTEEEHAHTRVI